MATETPVTCPKCGTCDFGLYEIGIGVYARCLNCGHQIEIEIINRGD